MYLILAGMLAGLTLVRGTALFQSLQCNRVNLSFNNPPERAANPRACEDYARGLYAATQGKPEQARPLWMSALLSSPRYLQAIRSHLPTDREFSQAAITAYPDNPQAWDWAGDALANQPAESLAYFQRAVELAPSANLVWEKVSAAAEKLGNLELTLQASQNACDIYPIRNGSCHRAARLFFARQDWERTIHYFAIGAYPEHPEDWALMVRACQHLGQEQRAQSLLQRARQENPADYARLLDSLP